MTWAPCKSYLDSGKSGIEKYTHAIEYSYSITPQIYRLEDSCASARYTLTVPSTELGLGSSSGSNSMMSAMMSTDVFYEMPENTDLYQGQYDVKAGRWPQNYNECVIVLTSGGSISDFLLYTLGLRDSDELDAMVQQFIDEENVDTPEDMGDYSYEDLLGALPSSWSTAPTTTSTTVSTRYGLTRRTTLTTCGIWWNKERISGS